MTSDLVPDDDAVALAHLQGLVRFWAAVFAVGLVIVLDPLCGYVAQQLPSIRHPSSPAYFIRYLLLHATPVHSPHQKTVALVGSSLVRDNLDERLLAHRLSTPSTTVLVANLGLQGAFAFSALILMDQLRRVEPDVVIWGVNAEMFSTGVGAVREDVAPWRRPMALEFGSTVLYRYFPDLAGRHRALSDELALRHWALYRNRLFFRQFLAALYRARERGWARVFGPYQSEAIAGNPERLQAALARRLKLAAGAQQTLALTPEQLETVFATANSIVSSWGGQLVVAWLPTAMDGRLAPSPAFPLVERACASRAIPFLDLRATVPSEAFSDSVHATVEGKVQTSEALASRLRGIFGETAGGGP